jgi:hypothetical protein
LIDEGVVEHSKEAQRVRVLLAYQSQKIFIMAQKQVMPKGWDSIDPMRSVKVNKGMDNFKVYLRQLHLFRATYSRNRVYDLRLAFQRRNFAGGWGKDQSSLQGFPTIRGKV